MNWFVAIKERRICLWISKSPTLYLFFCLWIICRFGFYNSLFLRRIHSLNKEWTTKLIMTTMLRILSMLRKKLNMKNQIKNNQLTSKALSWKILIDNLYPNTKNRKLVLNCCFDAGVWSL
ncbi:hypothetical protein LINGRAPRIM_LOCUS2165 [Linum grandiflorum]